MTEQVLGIVGATATGKRTLFSGYSNVHCFLVFTTGRLIVASTGVRQVWHPVGPYAMLVGGDDLRKVSVEDVMRSQEGNIAIPYSEITKVQLGSKWLNPRVHIHTANSAHRFMWTWPWVGRKRVESIIRRLLPVSIPIEEGKLD